jgi:hypothetical protein
MMKIAAGESSFAAMLEATVAFLQAHDPPN